MDSRSIKDEVIPYNPDGTQSLPSSPTESPIPEQDEITLKDYRTALHLLVGASLEGGDELRKRLKTWLEDVQSMEQEIGAPAPGEKDQGGYPLFYTFLGLVFKTPDLIDRGIKNVDHLTGVTTSFASRLMEPIRRSWVLRPVWRRYDSLVDRGEAVAGSLEESGRVEASFSRTLVRQQVNEDRVQEFLVYLVERSKMREMIVETSADLGEDALTEVRGASASVDSSLDKFVDKILKRQKQTIPPDNPSS